MNERRKIRGAIVRELEGYTDPDFDDIRVNQLYDDITGAVMARLGFEDED